MQQISEIILVKNKYVVVIISLVLILLLTACSNTEHKPKNNNLPAKANPYLEQKPPSLIPEPFAPGMVSTKGWEVGGVFTPDLKAFFYINLSEESKKQEIVTFINQGNQWQETVLSPRKGQPFVSPDSKTLHLGNWYMEHTESGWSEMKNLGAPFKDFRIMRLTASAKGTYFFDEFKPDFTGDIRFSRLVDGQHEEPKLLGKRINDGKSFHPFIAPDESYLLFDGEREGGYGDSDIYISFKQQDSLWGEPINLGDKINTPAWEACASITPDGKYLFFNRTIGPIQDDTSGYENIDIFWVDSKVIEQLNNK